MRQKTSEVAVFDYHGLHNLVRLYVQSSIFCPHHVLDWVPRYGSGHNSLGTAWRLLSAFHEKSCSHTHRRVQMVSMRSHVQIHVTLQRKWEGLPIGDTGKPMGLFGT
jgi:hypothetical protein